MKKILSLCFPTYNRGWCVKEQIERLQSLPSHVLDKIEIIISNNCSTDDTHEIVQNAISDGFICRYYRNEENLGMDGNFVSCFKKAAGKYVWLLGDDDFLIPDAFIKVVSFLETTEELGLVHISQLLNGQSSEQYTFYNETNSYVRNISYCFTFISANIVNTKYVPLIDFDRYFGTFFTLMPLYITAASNEKNCIVNYRVFENAKDHQRNGGYNFYKVFAINYLDIWKEFLDKKVITTKTYKYLKKDIFSHIILPQTYRFLFVKQDKYLGNENACKLLFKNYKDTAYFYFMPFRLAFMYLYCNLYRPFKQVVKKAR